MVRRIAAVVAIIGLVLVATGWRPGEERAARYVAIRTGFELGGPTALIHGHLIDSDGCLWIAGDDGGRYLPLWGRGAHAYGVSDGPPTVVEADGHKLIVGSSVSLGGGERKDVEGVEPVLQAPIPSACRVGPFWWVTSVEEAS